MNGDHAAALERLKTFAAEAAADPGPSHAHDVALVLELLRDARRECMAAVCAKCRDGHLVQRVDLLHGKMWAHDEAGGRIAPCLAGGIRDLPGCA